MANKSNPLSYKSYEQHLNQLYAETYNWDEVVENFGQWSKSEQVLRNNYDKETLGTFVRKRSPGTFFAGYNEWAVGERARLAASGTN